MDLRRRQEAERWIRDQAPDAVVLAAARPADVGKLLFLGSSCVYPRAAPQPIPEEALLTGPLEPTNESYAITKIAGIKLCQAYRRQFGCNFISLIPCNLYGPGDNFDLASGHVVPGLMRRMHEAKVADRREVVVWGTGTPRREFLHVDDLADAAVHLLRTYAGEPPVNVGTGRDITIAALVDELKAVTGFRGEAMFDASKPDGTPRKVLDVTRLNALGWRPGIEQRAGLESTYRWFRESGIQG